MCKAWLCSACACSGTISFSVLCCTLGSSSCPFSAAQLYPEHEASCDSPKAFCDLLPNHLDTHTMPRQKALGEAISGLISLLQMCLARNRRWMGRRETPHVAIYFKICKWLAILSFYHILYQQLCLNYTTSDIFDESPPSQSPHLHLGKEHSTNVPWINGRLFSLLHR